MQTQWLLQASAIVRFPNVFVCEIVKYILLFIVCVKYSVLMISDTVVVVVIRPFLYLILKLKHVAVT